MFRLFSFSAALLLLVSVVPAQKALLEKPIEKWSQKEAMEILNDSAWARTYQSVQGAANAAASEALRAQSDNSLRGSERSRTERSGAPAPVIMRLHSGLPIRLALVRLNQLGAGYDKMSDDDKMKFNEGAKKLLDCAICQNYYVVTLTLMSNPTGQTVEEAIFQGMTLEQLKENVWLKNDKGVTRPLIQFVAPQKRGDSAVFFFARKDDKGDVFLTKENTDLSFVFNGNFFNSSNRFAAFLPRQFDFKLSKITVGDNLVF
jgi:hypothetical protein